MMLSLLQWSAMISWHRRQPAISRCVFDVVKRLKNMAKSGEPSGTRTRDPLVKSQLLYRLSYQPTLRTPILYTFRQLVSTGLRWEWAYAGLGG